MTRLRIALYHNLHSGGAKRVVAEHLRRLAERHDLVLFSLKNADHTFGQISSDSNSKLSATLFDHRPLSWLPSPFGRLNRLIGLAEVYRLNQLARYAAHQIDQRGFDVVLVHPCQITQAPLILRWLQTPSVYYCHELPRRLYEKPIQRPYLARSRGSRLVDYVDPLPTVQDSLMRSLDRANARRASRILTNSQFTKSNILNAYQRNAEVCYPGVDANAFTPTASARERLVLSVGALTPLKGFDFVIRSLATLPEQKRPPLVIISNYQEQQELQYLNELAAQCRVRLSCLANLSDIELRDYYSRAGCLAYAPVNEPLGLVALEAMAAAVPVIGVDEGGIKETIVDGVTGRLVKREPIVFGQTVEQILEDQAYARSLGQAGRQNILNNWTWDVHILSLEKHLFDIAGSSSRNKAQ